MRSTTASSPHCLGSSNPQTTSSTKSNENNEIIRRLTIASILCLTFIIVELIGGILSSSLAILSDAAHLFSDLASFLIAIIASKLAVLPPDSHNTFGFKRAEALAALFSMSCLFAVSLVLGVEAVHRGILFWHVQQDMETDADGSVTGLVVDGKIMTLTATVGVFVNICLAFVLGEHHHHGPLGGGHDHSHEHEHGHKHEDDHDHDHHSQEHHNQSPDTSTHSHSHDHGHDHGHGHEHEHEMSTEESTPLVDNGRNNTTYNGTNSTTCETQEPSPPPPKEERNVNLQAAYLHVLADLLQSVCVLLSGLLIWYNPHWQLIDPCITILFCVVVIRMTMGVILSSISVLMNDVPPTVNWTEVYDGIVSEEGISCVQDLHIWSISHSNMALSAHVEYEEAYAAKDVLERIQDVCRKFGIYHTTVQLQSGVGEEVA
mmetsp:Transcript_5008/g.5825  ORF Transcript_5008/g.5825 Transcript_5008/m.5825 type:complete len:431 (-) Transcript_5008:64-1356(-)